MQIFGISRIHRLTLFTHKQYYTDLASCIYVFKYTHTNIYVTTINEQRDHEFERGSLKKETGGEMI